MEFIYTVLTLGFIALALWVFFWVIRFCWNFLKALWQLPIETGSRTSSDLDGMDEGDFHNGPGGYHPGGGRPRG